MSIILPMHKKATSSGSQYSVSASDDVTVPNPTPLTEALDSEVVDPPPEIDFDVMSKLLAPIAEQLNEEAEEAKYPNPPINTPNIASPAASIIHRHVHPRSRGMSTLGDRLARAMTEGRIRHDHDSDAMSASNRSICSYPPIDDASDGGLNEVVGEGNKGKQAIQVALGLPRVNPAGLYSFTSNDLSDRAPVPYNSTVPVEESHVVGIGSGSHKPTSQISLVSTGTGVTEMSNWKEDVEDNFERALKSLENLAHDEHQQDSSKSVEYYYTAYLKRLLGNRNRKIRVSIGVLDRNQ